MHHKGIINIYWVYILECENGNYYTGYTNNLLKRFQSHLDGSSKCKYTRAFKVKRLAQSWEIKSSKSSAMRIEHYIKKLSKSEKINIINTPALLTSKIIELIEK